MRRRRGDLFLLPPPGLRETGLATMKNFFSVIGSSGANLVSDSKVIKDYDIAALVVELVLIVVQPFVQGSIQLRQSLSAGIERLGIHVGVKTDLPCNWVLED